MDRLRRIANLWNWLPAFRAVAETEHLQQAAEMLGTSAPALSRTIRLLEDCLDAPLFHRNGGKRLQLTDLGRVLAAATREGMRRVDEAVAVAAPELKLTGPLRVSSEGRLTTFVTAALVRLRRHHPAITPHMTCAPTSEVLARLLRGHLDVAVVFRATPHPDIVIEKLGLASNGIYCGREHPLYDVELPTLTAVLGYPFAAPEPSDAAPSSDNWPPEHARRIAFYSETLDGDVEACASGDYLAVLPDRVVPAFASGSLLRRLPFDLVPPCVLYAMKRAPVGNHSGRAESLIHELRDGARCLRDAQRSSPSRATEADTAGVTSVSSPPMT